MRLLWGSAARVRQASGTCNCQAWDNSELLSPTRQIRSGYAHAKQGSKFHRKRQPHAATLARRSIFTEHAAWAPAADYPQSLKPTRRPSAACHQEHGQENVTRSVLCFANAVYSLPCPLSIGLCSSFGFCCLFVLIFPGWLDKSGVCFECWAPPACKLQPQKLDQDPFLPCRCTTQGLGIQTGVMALATVSTSMRYKSLC